MINNDLLKRKIIDSIIDSIDYPIKKISDIASVVSKGTTPRGGNVCYTENGVLFVRAENIGYCSNNLTNKKYVDVDTHNNFLKRSILKENDILVSIAGALGRTSYVEKDMLPCNCNQAVAFIRIKDNVDFVPQYICYCIISKKVQASLLSQVKKTAQPNLTLEHIKNIEIPIPVYEKQLEITKKIEKIFNLIDKKEKNDQEKVKLKEIFKEKILDSAIRGLLIKNDNKIINYEKPLFDVPLDWKWVTFSDVATIVRGGSPRPIKDYLTESNDGINWIKIGDTNPNEYYINHVKEKIKPEGMKKSRFVEKGSLLLTNSMSFGRPYILNVDGCIHDGWLNIKDNGNNFYNLYMVYLLSSKYFYNVMCDKSSGAVVSNLNIDKVKSMMIPLPPLEEQHRIVEKIEQCFELIEQL